MTTYTKLFRSLTMSSIWREDDKTRIVWITLLAEADKHGEVEASIPGLANLAGVSVADAEKAIEKLAAPDHYSRTKDHEGRRIEAIDGGWRVLNHAKYRAKASKEDRLEQDRLRKQRMRGSPKASAPVRTPSAKVRKSPHKQTQTQNQTDTHTQKTGKERADLPVSHCVRNLEAECMAIAEASDLDGDFLSDFIEQHKRDGWTIPNRRTGKREPIKHLEKALTAFCAKLESDRNGG